MLLVALVVLECFQPAECLHALSAGGTINISTFGLDYFNMELWNLLRLLVKHYRKQMSLILSTFSISITLR